jgi:biopolymer transport protein ExbB
MELVLNYFDKGGIVFFALGLLSVFSITIIVYKFLDIYFFNDLNLKKFIVDFDKISSLEEIESLITDSRNKKKIILNDIKYFLDEIIESPKKDDEVYFYLNTKFKKIQFLMPTLEIISQVSPLIGLLGTVIGMIDSFNELELGGSLVDPSILAGGIWTALLTTAMGLLVAIPALVSHYFFEKKINSLYEFYYFFLIKISNRG